MTDFNASDRDVDRAIRSWLHEDRHEDVSRIAGAVLDQVDTTRQRRATWWLARRTPTVNKIVGFGLTAAALVVVVVGSQVFGSPAPGGVGAEPTLSPTLEPSVAAPSPSAGGNPVGSFVLYDGQEDGPSVTVTLPASGWYGDPGGDPGLGGTVAKDQDVPGEVGISFFVVTHVYGDACQSEGTLSAIGPSPENLVAALLAQEDIAADGPTDVTIGGYPAQRIDLEYPPGLDASTCRHGADLLQVWADEAETYFYVVGQGQRSSVYVADVDGERMVITAGIAQGASDEDIAELDAVLASVTIGE